MPDADRHRSAARQRAPKESRPVPRPASGNEPPATADSAQPGREAHPTTTRDTVEAEAYSQAHSAPEAEHATNQTTDDSLRKQRSHTH